MTISGGRTEQLDIIAGFLPRHWLYEWFSQFHLEHIRFFHGALLLSVYCVMWFCHYVTWMQLLDCYWLISVWCLICANLLKLTSGFQLPAEFKKWDSPFSPNFPRPHYETLFADCPGRYKYGKFLCNFQSVRVWHRLFAITIYLWLIDVLYM